MSQISAKIRTIENQEVQESVDNKINNLVEDSSNLLQGITFSALDKQIPQDALGENEKNSRKSPQTSRQKISILNLEIPKKINRVQRYENYYQNQSILDQSMFVDAKTGQVVNNSLIVGKTLDKTNQSNEIFEQSKSFIEEFKFSFEEEKQSRQSSSKGSSSRRKQNSGFGDLGSNLMPNSKIKDFENSQGKSQNARNNPKSENSEDFDLDFDEIDYLIENRPSDIQAELENYKQLLAEEAKEERIQIFEPIHPAVDLKTEMAIHTQLPQGILSPKFSTKQPKIESCFEEAKEYIWSKQLQLSEEQAA